MSEIMSMLKIDPRWEGFQNDIKQELLSVSQWISFRKEIDKKIVERFRMVKRLIEFSIYEYEFLDVALERCLPIFELALKTRYNEIEEVKIKRKNNNLYYYIEWANNNNLFDEDVKKVHTLRKLKNALVSHVNRNSIMGTIQIPTILDIVLLINGLYDNISLRKKRKNIISDINKKLKEFIKNGAIIKINDKRYIIFEGELVVYENRGSNDYYHFYFFPIFKLERGAQNIHIPKPYILKCSKITINKEKIILHCPDREIIITNIKKDINKKKYLESIQSFGNDKIEKSIQYTSAMRNTMKKIKIFHRNYLIEYYKKLNN